MECNLENKFLNYDGTYKTIEEIWSQRIKVTEEIRYRINKEDDPLILGELALLGLSIAINDRVIYHCNKDKLLRNTKENL